MFGTMGIFSENPKSFKMDRKSPRVSNLKSSISNKLLQFLGSDIDDVLTYCTCRLWDLLKYAQQSNSAIGLFYPKDSSVTIPSSGGTDRALGSNRSKDAQNHGNGTVDISLTKNEKDCHPSVCATSLVPSNNVELYDGSQYCKGPVAPSNGKNTKKA